MIILEQRVLEDREWDRYTIRAVLDELSRNTERAYVATYAVRPLQPIRKNQLVAPMWSVMARVTESDRAGVDYWTQEAAVFRNGRWHPALEANWQNTGVTIAGIVDASVAGVFDLRTGTFRIDEVAANSRTGRRVRPSREELRLFTAWLRQWLPDRSPIKNPGRVRRRA